MPAVHSYPQYCPMARALDVLGDRWTLLVLRELTIHGDLRFTDLRRQVRGITPSVLTDRLRSLSEHGLVETRELPPPAARTVYATTVRGREVVPVLRALARFGVPLLEEPPEDAPLLRPANAAHALVMPFYDAAAAAGVDERYVLVVDGVPIELDTVRRGDPARRPPDVVLTTSARTLLDVRRRVATFDEAVADGRIGVEGPPAAVANLTRIFRLAGAGV